MGKRGPQPKGEYGGKIARTAVLSTRLQPDTRARLSEAAKANKRSLSQELENRLRGSFIEEDKVIIGHEATVSKIGDEQLFYLMARGIPEVEAEALLVQAFIGEAVEGIEHAGLRDALMEHVVAWLRARGG